MKAVASRAKTKIVAIVRDKNGKVRFDDPNNVQPEVMAALTKEDLKHLIELQNVIPSKQSKRGI